MTTPPSRTSWIMCIALALLSVIGLVLGHQLYVCGGLFSAMLWTVLLLGFFLLLVPQYAVSYVLAIAAIAVTLRAWSANPKIREETDLLAFALPTAGIAVGLGLAYLLKSPLTCSLGFWR